MSKSQQIGSLNVSLMGKFSLVVNRNAKKFRMTNINAFVPNGKSIDGKVLFKSASGEVEYLLFDRITTVFKPDVSEIDYHNVTVFIQHPDVRLASITNEAYESLVKQNLKNPNPTFTLTNIDAFEDVRQEKEVNLLKIRYKIYDDNSPLSKREMMYICSNLQIPYKTEISDELRYKVFLQKQLDKYVQSSQENLVSFDEISNNIKNAERIYYVNEFKTMGIVTESGGIYKIKETPIGPDMRSILLHFEQNPEKFTMFKKMVIQNNEETVYN